MLNDVLLYLSSAMAQVWAALLIFEALKFREDKREVQAELNRIYDIARNNIAHMILAIKCFESYPSLKLSIKDLPKPEWQKFWTELNKAMTINESLMHALKYLKEHDLLGKMEGSNPTNNRLGLNSWIEAQSMCNDYLEQMETHTLDTYLINDFYQIKFNAYAIILNLIGLCVVSFFDSFNPSSPNNDMGWLFLALLTSGNILALYLSLIKKKPV